MKHYRISQKIEHIHLLYHKYWKLIDDSRINSVVYFVKGYPNLTKMHSLLASEAATVQQKNSLPAWVLLGENLNDKKKRHSIKIKITDFYKRRAKFTSRRRETYWHLWPQFTMRLLWAFSEWTLKLVNCKRHLNICKKCTYCNCLD